MNLARVSLFSVVLLACVLATPTTARSQDWLNTPGVNRSSGIFANGISGWDALDTRARIGTSIGDGVGYAAGLNQLGVFQPIWIVPGEVMLFIEPRGILTYRGQLASNVGAGFRWYNPEFDRILGASAWWDVANSGERNYQQWGGSFESLGKYLDARFNVYIPNNRGSFVNSTTFNGDVFFTGPNVALGRTRNIESPLRGMDFEVGGALPYIGDIGFRPYVGGYYYDNTSSAAAYGVRARTDLMVTQDFMAQFAVTNDKIFGTNLYGGFMWTLPNGQPTKWFQRTPTQYRMYAPTERQYRVAVERRDVQDVVMATNPRTGLAINVVHVNNARGTFGATGTAEDPLLALPSALDPAVDIIYVHRGNGTSINYNGGITLADFQRLLGEGRVHQVATVENGIVNLPTGSPGPFPIITSMTGAAVTLANNNEVSGFQIANPALHGITGTNISNFNLNNLTITNPGVGLPPTGGGIVLTNAAGIGSISNVNISGGELGSVIVNNGPGTAPLSMTMGNSTFVGGVNGIRLIANGATILNNYSNVSSTGAENGMELIATNSGVVASTGSNGRWNNNTRTGINISADNSTVTQSSIADQSNNNGLRGVSVAASNNSTINLIFNAGQIQNNVQAGVGLTAINNSTSNVQFLNGVQVLANGGNGFDANTSVGSNLNLQIVDANFSNNTGFHGVFVNTSGSTVTSNIVRSTFTNNTSGGLRFDGSAGSVLNLFMNDSNVSNNGGAGLQLHGLASNVTASLDNNLFNANNGSGVWNNMNTSTFTFGGVRNRFTNNNGFGIGTQANASQVIENIGGPDRSIASNLFDNNQGSGFFTRLFGASLGQITFLNNTVTRTRAGANEYTGQGVFVALANTAQLNSSIFDGNWIGVDSPVQPFPAAPSAGNASDGMQVAATDNTQINNLLIGNTAAETPPAVTGNLFVNNGGNGLNINRLVAARINNTVIQNNIFAQNTLNGVNLTATHTFTAENTFAINNNDFRNNVINGLVLRADASSAIAANMDNNLFRNNTGNGVLVTGIANSNFDPQYVRGTWTRNQITNNGGWGINTVGLGTLASFGGKTGSGPANPLNIGLAGQGNLIANNGQGGIQQTTPGFTEVTNNQITNNGAANGLSGSGIRVAVLNVTNPLNPVDLTGRFDATGIGGLNFNTTNNIIAGNAGDGITLLNTSTFTIFNLNYGNSAVGSELVSTNRGNLISGNSGRGLNIINRGDAGMLVRVGGAGASDSNLIQANLREGIYIVNTTARDQSETADSSLALSTSGNFIDAPNMVLDIRGNQVIGNGLNTTYQGSGLLLRVGTSNGPDLGAAGSGSTQNAFGTLAGLNGNGRVNARINNNTLSGNLAADVLIESFNSTAVPGVTSGTWSDTEFTLTGGNNDPLARLNLEFRNNTGGSADVTRVGAFLVNAEPQFKSRDVTQTPPGPFPAGGARERNGQRLGSRSAPFNFPNTPVSVTAANWFYPGVGASTFRVTSDSVLPGPVADGFGLGTNFTSLVAGPAGTLGYTWTQILPGSITFP